jgi:hypothetical protein
MTTAMITACFTGLVRAAGILSSVVISSEFIYFLFFSETPEEAKENFVFNPSRSKLLFSGASYSAKEISVCNPYRFKNVSKLTAKALGFIFFVNHCKYHSSILWRTSLIREDVFANPGKQKITTCL